MLLLGNPPPPSLPLISHKLLPPRQPQDGADPALVGHAGTVRAFMAAGGGVLVAASTPSPWNSVPAITSHPANLLMAPLGISVGTAAQQTDVTLTATPPSQAAANAEAQIDCLVAVVRLCVTGFAVRACIVCSCWTTERIESESSSSRSRCVTKSAHGAPTDLHPNRRSLTTPAAPATTWRMQTCRRP